MFCEFDPRLGPQIAYQAPEDFISKSQFDSIAPYIITKPQLQSRLISLKASGYTFMGYPVIIEDKKYTRNALIFNVVFVFHENDHVREYGIDYKERIEQVGFQVEMINYSDNFSEEMIIRYGLLKNDLIPIAKKII